MLDKLLAIVAPHHCCGCHKIGTLLCDNCKYNIESEPYAQCIACGLPAGATGICTQCNVPYNKAWCVGERSGVLQRLIGGFKFQYMSAAHTPLAALLAERIDQLPPDTIIVPVPTVAAHIRERGYDHTLLLANTLASLRKLKVKQVLQRVTATKQRDASRAQRIAQAKAAFGVHDTIDPSRTYLLIDDVVTTGATIYYATLALREAGAQHIWVAAIARQPLD